MIDPVAAAALPQFKPVSDKKPVAIVERDMLLVGKEFPGQLLDVRHLNMLSPVIALVNQGLNTGFTSELVQIDR